jgi:hypothetical protein
VEASYQYVDRQPHQRGLPSAEALASLPLELAHFDRYSPGQGATELTVEALVAVEGSAEELDLFVRAVRWLARRELDYELPSPTDTGHVLLTSTEFARDEGVELDRLHLAKILALLRVEWLTISSGGPGEQEPIWQVTVDQRIRPYADVSAVDDYLAIKKRLAAEAVEQSPSTWPVETLPLAPEVGEIAIEGSADPHKVFVVYGRTEAARVACSSCCGRSVCTHWNGASCAQRLASHPRTSARSST